MVRDYFAWLTHQTDADHKSLLQDMRYRLSHPDDKVEVTSAKEIEELWTILIEKILVPYFAKRQDFFRKQYISYPKKRIWWLRNLFAKGMTNFSRRAYAIWKNGQRDREQQQFRNSVQNHRSNCPLSPYEWQDPNTSNRYYDDPLNGTVLIPPEAPPRPNTAAFWNPFSRLWEGGV